MASSDATSNRHQETGEPSDGSRRPIYKTETTGNYWQDVWIALKRISVVDDFQRLGEMPCARNSLLSGIASGAGVGFIRAMSASPFVASNWAVGTFMVISLGTWTVCQKNMEAERRRLIYNTKRALQEAEEYKHQEVYVLQGGFNRFAATFKDDPLLVENWEENVVVW